MKTTRYVLVSLLTALGTSNSNCAFAEVKAKEFGKAEGYPHEIGWPFRMTPKFRHGGLTGKGLTELEGKVKPFWISPPSKRYPVPRSTPQAWVSDRAKQLMAENTIMAMLLVKNGNIVFEQYQYETTESTLFDSQSIAKTLTALSLGLLADKGMLPSLETPMGRIVPELSRSPIGKASLRQTLQMQCGHEFKWVDKGAESSAGKYAQIRFALYGGSRNLYQYFQTLPATPPGAIFSYDPHCSDALSMVVTKITGKTLRENFEKDIWHAIGAESRAAWLSPFHHAELTTGASAFYATLRDWGRLALLFLNEGAYGSNRIISGEWIKSMHSDKVDVGNYPSNFKYYGYQTWVRTEAADSWYAGLGNHGQRFYIDGNTKSAMIIFALDESHIRMSDQFWDDFRKKH